MKRATRPVLITDAARSQEDQLRSRQIRYLAMMSIRAACLIIGAILVSVQAPLLWLWLPLCGVGMVLLPWLAVIVANDRLAKPEHRLANKLHHHRQEEPAPQALTAEEQPRRTVDHHP